MKPEYQPKNGAGSIILLPALETPPPVLRCNRQTLDSLAGTKEGSYAGFHLTTSGGPLEIQNSDHKVIWGYGNNPFNNSATARAIHPFYHWRDNFAIVDTTHGVANTLM